MTSQDSCSCCIILLLCSSGRPRTRAQNELITCRRHNTLTTRATVVFVNHCERWGRRDTSTRTHTHIRTLTQTHTRTSATRSTPVCRRTAAAARIFFFALVKRVTGRSQRTELSSRASLVRCPCVVCSSVPVRTVRLSLS